MFPEKQGYYIADFIYTQKIQQLCKRFGDPGLGKTEEALGRRDLIMR